MSLLTGLSAFYKFNGNGYDEVTAASGSFPTPGGSTPVGAPAQGYVTGKLSQGVQGQFALPGLGPGISSQWSASFWVKNPSQATLPMAAGSYFGLLLNHATPSGSTGLIWEQASPGGQSRVCYFDASVAARVSGNWFTAPNAYVHVVWNFNAGAGELWINGVLDATFTGLVNVGALNMVNAGYGGVGWQNGSLDELGIWGGRILTSGEIARLYNAGNALSHPFPAAPVVTIVDPATGPATGGAAVTITGTGFVSGATVAFDGIPATSVVFVSATSITCVTPAHAAGAVNVVVTNPDLQTGTAVNAFSYLAVAAPPPVSSAGSRLLDLLPPGRLWQLEAGSFLHRLLVGIGDEVERVIVRARDLVEETDPRTATETIAEWERNLALPDEQVLSIPATLAGRRVAVTQKLVGRTGQDLQFFTALCAACGYPLNALDRYAAAMLRVNGRVGARLYGAAWAYSMRLTLNAPTAGALSTADFERVIRHVTHAHIVVVFTYL